MLTQKWSFVDLSYSLYFCFSLFICKDKDKDKDKDNDILLYQK